MKQKAMAYFGGLIIIIGSHLYMLFVGLPESQFVAHAIINLVAGALIVFSKAK